MTESELEATCRQVVANPESVMVVYKWENLHPCRGGPRSVFSQHVSNKPMYSIAYADDCIGVAMFDHTFAGLSHYDLSSGDPEVYLRLMEQNIRQASADNRNLKAVPIGGDETHYERVLKFLAENKIQLIQGYCRPGMKKLFVIPSTQEAILHSPTTGFRRLAGSY